MVLQSADSSGDPSVQNPADNSTGEATESPEEPCDSQYDANNDSDTDTAEENDDVSDLHPTVTDTDSSTDCEASTVSKFSLLEVVGLTSRNPVPSYLDNHGDKPYVKTENVEIDTSFDTATSFDE